MNTGTGTLSMTTNGPDINYRIPRSYQKNPTLQEQIFRGNILPSIIEQS